MPQNSVRIVGMLSAMVDPTSKDIILTCKTEHEPNQEIRIHPGIVGGLAVALMGLGAAAGPAQGAPGIVGQVMNLNGVRPAVGPQGQLVLDLILENGFHFPVTFPPDAIRGLQTALAELQKVATATQAKPSQKH